MEFKEPQSEQKPEILKEESDVEKDEDKEDWRVEPEELLRLFEGYESQDLIDSRPRSYDPEKTLPKLKQLLPEKSIDFKRTKEKGCSVWLINIGDEYEVKVRRSSELGFVWSIFSPEMDSPWFKWDGDEIPSLYDLANIIKDPLKGLEDIEEINERAQEFYYMRTISEWFFQEEMGTSFGFYGVSDQGSDWGCNTLAHLFNFGLSAESRKQFVDLQKLAMHKEISSDVMLDRIKAAQPFKGKSVLEVGSGPHAPFLSLLESLGAECVGVDIQEPFSDSSIEIYQADISDKKSIPPELKNRKFDYVISTMTILPEVIDHDIGAAYNSLSFLKEGGVAVFSPEVSFFDLPEDEYFSYENLRKDLQPNDASVIRNIPADQVDTFDIF